MRDMKQRERKQRHQNAGVETARKESAAQKCQLIYIIAVIVWICACAFMHNIDENLCRMFLT